MSQPNQSPDVQTRQACEPCRRKKTKCTAERPTCSFCARLGTACMYLPRGRTLSTAKDRVTKNTAMDRFRRLENQMSDLYDMLRASSNDQLQTGASQGDPQSPMTLDFAVGSPDTTSPERRAQLPSQEPPAATGKPKVMPPIEVIQKFVVIYEEKLHLQPLPLFAPNSLARLLSSSPHYLLWSFLSLMLSMASHEYYQDHEIAMRDLYARSSEDTTIKMASEGVLDTALAQALCLIALKHIHCEQPARACMAIGLASQLNLLRRLSPRRPVSDEPASRAYWSVFMLERLFLPPPPSDLLQIEAPRFPESAPAPPPAAAPSPLGKDRYPSYSEAYSCNKDVGINEMTFRLVSIWGKIRAHIHRLRHGHTEQPWRPDSTHAKLNLELVEWESGLGKKHLLVNLDLSSRTRDELDAHHEYWRPWLTMQILSHATHALINHPFVHLIVLRSRDGVPVSRIFLQQTVDVALFNSGWVCRMLQICRGKIDIVDPFIGDIIAATATVPWLFQFAKDPKISQRAQNDFRICLDTLGHMVNTWPHIMTKLNVLNSLQYLWIDSSREAPSPESTINFKSKWLWNLLSPTISPPPGTGSAPSEHALGGGNDPDARMLLTTHFVHPLREDQDDDQSQDSVQLEEEGADELLASLGDLSQFNVDEISTGLFQYGAWEELGDLAMPG